MKVKKQNISIGKPIFEGEIKSSAEGSIIVPDVKPDILKILQVDAEAFLCEKIIDDGKVVIKGKVRTNVLYLPEGDNCYVQSLKGYFEFCETLKRSEFSPDMRICAVCDVEKVSYKLINSRKVGIDAKVSIGLEVFGSLNSCYVCDVEDSSAQSRYKDISICAVGKVAQFSFNIDETAEIPAGKGNACEILKSNIMIFEKDYKALSGKLVIKGKADVCILYNDENNCCEHMEIEVPFTEVFDVEDLPENAVCDITYEVGETQFSVSPDANANMRCIDISAEIGVCVKTEIQEDRSVLSDCYFTNVKSEFNYEMLETEQTVERPVFSVMVKEILEKDANQPDIKSIYTACAKPAISAVQIQSGRLAVSGNIDVYLLYTSDNSDSPVCSIKAQIPFSYMIDCENADRSAEALLTCECEHLSYIISSPGSVEIRCGIKICGKIIKKTQVNLITDINTQELPCDGCGMIIYFVRGGESLWSIAKKYHVRTDSIKELNGIEDDTVLTKGDKLIIPVCH